MKKSFAYFLVVAALCSSGKPAQAQGFCFSGGTTATTSVGAGVPNAGDGVGADRGDSADFPSRRRELARHLSQSVSENRRYEAPELLFERRVLPCRFKR